jgi:site-specific DNA-methyltransferase (adenine-specific)
MTRRSSVKPFYQSEHVSLYFSDALRVMARMPSASADMVFADPPYLLSNDGISCKSGRMVSVNKGEWDRSKGVTADYQWNLEWLSECQRLLTKDGSLWVTGTNHNIYLVGHAIQELGYRIVNDICWFKPNAAPNISCRAFTHSHETLIWATRSRDSKRTFNYELMKQQNGGRQMRSMWTLNAPTPSEKAQGKHPTQKPLALLERVVMATTNPGDHILDPFMGSGTTGVAALKHGRLFTGVEYSLDYADLARRRIMSVTTPLF